MSDDPSDDPNYRVTTRGDTATVHVTNPETNKVEKFTFNVAGEGSYSKADAQGIADFLAVDRSGTTAAIMKRVRIAALEQRTSFVKPGAQGQPFFLSYKALQRMSTRARPWVFGPPRTAGASEALRDEHPVTHVIGVPAYGYSGKGTKDSAREAIEAKAQWKFNCISFEVWCQLTGYDDSKQDGGELFQRMCHYLLVDGRQSNNTKFEPQYFNQHGKLSGPNWETVQPRDDTFWDKSDAQYVCVSDKSVSYTHLRAHET